MPNNYLQFSEQLVLKNHEEKVWFERYMAASSSDSEGWDDEAKPVSEEAKFWHEILGDDDFACFEWELEEEPLHIWFHADEAGSPNQVAELVKRFFKEMRPEGKDGFAISWSETCSKMRAGEFGGGACLITKDEIHYLNTWQWLEELTQQLHVE